MTMTVKMTMTAKTFHDDAERIDWNLTNHTPNEEQLDAIQRVRVAMKRAGHVIVAACPNSREKSLALTAIEEVAMWAVASIARSYFPTIEAYAPTPAPVVEQVATVEAATFPPTPFDYDPDMPVML